MMDLRDIELVAMLAFLLCTMTSRWIHERAFAALDEATRVRFMDASARHRVFSLLPAIALVAVVFFSTKYLAQYPLELLVFFVLLMFGMIGGMSIFAFCKILRLGLPRHYIIHYIWARALTFLDAILYLAGSIVRMLNE